MAVCKDPRHHDESECKRVRTINPPARRALTNPGQGRPLGLLVAWLMAGSKYETAKQHKNAIGAITKEQKLAARQAFFRDFAGAEMGDLERKKDEGEASEPEVIK